jgi:hypothetical protein
MPEADASISRAVPQPGMYRMPCKALPRSTEEPARGL